MPEKVVNKVILGNQTIMDVTDATASASDIIYGESAYLADGTKGVGTLNSKPAANGGTDLSLVTTGEKYTWNNPVKAMSHDLTAGDDINNVTQTGFYNIYATDGTYPSNMPENSRSGMLVMYREGVPVQLIINNNHKLLYREKYSTGWQPWFVLQGTRLA